MTKTTIFYTMPTIKTAKLDWNETGTPVSEQFDDVYFSNFNGLEESRYVFLTQNGLPQRWNNHTQRRFVIAETGFGTGLNFLAVWQWFDKFRQENPDSDTKELHFISFEKYPLTQTDLEKSHQAWPELATYAEKLRAHYPIAIPECHRIEFDQGRITLDLWFGDIKEMLPRVPCNTGGIVDCWFLDGFAPSKNPDMWTQDLFDGMARLAKPSASCATFTAAGFVRRGLNQAGFSMQKVKGFGHKREMLAGLLADKPEYCSHEPYYARPDNGLIEDVAIIGGGIASALLAMKLCQRGKQVTLYCKDSEAAMNGSGNKQGAIYPLLNGSHTGVSRLYAPAFLYARQLVKHSAALFPFEHDWCGVTQLCWDDKSTKKLTRIMEADFPDTLIQKLTSEQTTQTIGLPSDVDSIYYPLGGWLNPKQFTQNLLEYLQRTYHLELIFNITIEQLKQTGEGKNWQLISKKQSFVHQAVVVANGYEYTQFEQTASIPASAVKGQVSHIPTTKSLKQLNTVLCYNGYMTPHNPATQHHCIGASHDRVNIDMDFDEQAQVDNRHKLLRSLPDQSWPEEVDISQNDAKQGIRCVTRDHLPFVGNVCDFQRLTGEYADLKKTHNQVDDIADYPNLFCLLALGGRGLCSAPLMAEVLASQISNDPLPLPVEVLAMIHPGKMWVRKLLKGRPLTLQPETK